MKGAHLQEIVVKYPGSWLSHLCLPSISNPAKVLSTQLINLFIGEVSRVILLKGKLVLKDRVECEQGAGTRSI